MSGWSGYCTSVASSLKISKQAAVNVWKHFADDKKVELGPSAGGGQNHITDDDL